jgi:uncharacterized membrane protein
MAAKRKARPKILLAGESWATSAYHVKGWDQFSSATYHLGGEDFVRALDKHGFDVDYLPNHLAAAEFPSTAATLGAYSAVVLSDIGSNTLLLPPDVWLHGKPSPNRMKLLRDYVAGGGGFMMVGGYLSFQGINGSARYARTPIEEILPVKMRETDDRLEIPEGFVADVTASGRRHPILAGFKGKWPVLLGANEVAPKATGTVLARLPVDCGGHPLLVAGTYKKGRTLAWTSDIGPHWLPRRFVDWPGYARLFGQAAAWLTQAA